MEADFGRSLTIGVEEELLLLDPDTLALAPGVERLLGPPGLKTELFSCLVETNTPVCDTVQEAAGELRRLRREVREAAAELGLLVAAAGAHPFSLPEEQQIVAEARYVKMLEELGPKMRRQLVCGLHVHVGMESFDACLETLAALVPWLPAVLALSLNSPYLAGEETGVLSARAGRLLELPRGGPPPPFASPEDWARRIAATGQDYTRSWWDARPHPRLGTLEIRIADQPTRVERTVAITALVQALCAARPRGDAPQPEAYLARRAAAAKGEAPTDELLALVEPAARELGTWELVEALKAPVEALRQLEVGHGDGLEAVAADLVQRTAR
ncbi:MAG: glutamate---cysteine ligase / carboxylate-amine ligase [Gaiellaceae bacterium]|nr:glutamate---cysteine ligase / carboxylate-amine ligase [Gaiellaceae bacterium]